jgi:hypothetical protein
MLDGFFTIIADGAELLRAAELEARRQYYEAVEKSDLSATRAAADEWIRAGDALNEYVAKSAPPVVLAADQGVHRRPGPNEKAPEGA